MVFLWALSQLPYRRSVIKIISTIKNAAIAPLLRVRAKLSKITNAAMPAVARCKGREVSDLRFLNFSRNKARAAKKANSAKEPAELLVVKKPLIPFE